jgi:hypothetical protein
LHFLLTRGVDARLVFLYFVGDREDLGRAGRVCPVDEEGRQGALRALDRRAALPDAAPIHDRIHRIFVPAYVANIAAEILKPEYARPTSPE